MDSEVDVPDFDLVAAALRADAGDVVTFMETLATKLEATLPGLVAITRVKSGFRGPKRVQAIALDSGSDRLELARSGAGLEAVRSRISGGIVLRRERLDTDAWLQALAEVLSEQAQRSQQTRQALARMLDV
jgi:hypothetical protein